MRQRHGYGHQWGIASCTLTLDARWPGQPASATAARHAAVEAARAAGAGPAVLRRVALAVTEAVANAILHAYDGARPGEVALRGWQAPGRVILEVRDQGRGLAPRDDSPGLGLGLVLIRQAADDVRISSAADEGTAVRLEFALE
jgi:anti-sigma regulatory factor (Ser/Thr protein kinase)